MNVVVIEYNAGNVCSVQNALLRLGITPIVSNNSTVITQADKVIFPGVGHAQPTMQYLQKYGLESVIKNLQQPVLGICLGQQLLCSFSEEGNTTGLGVFPIQVKKFVADNDITKIPQMGWNTLYNLQSPLFKDIPEQSYAYFVHSYYCEDSDYTIAKTDYSQTFVAALHHKNFYATQFHPEKSDVIGSKILDNFLALS